MVEVSSDQKVAFLAHFATKPTFLGVSGNPHFGRFWGSADPKKGTFGKIGHFGHFWDFWQIWPIWSFLEKVVLIIGKNRAVLAKIPDLAILAILLKKCQK